MKIVPHKENSMVEVLQNGVNVVQILTWQLQSTNLQWSRFPTGITGCNVTKADSHQHKIWVRIMKYLSHVSKCFEVHSAGVSRFGCSALYSVAAFNAHLWTLHWIAVVWILLSLSWGTGWGLLISPFLSREIPLCPALGSRHQYESTWSPRMC